MGAYTPAGAGRRPEMSKLDSQAISQPLIAQPTQPTDIGSDRHHRHRHSSLKRWGSGLCVLGVD